MSLSRQSLIHDHVVGISPRMVRTAPGLATRFAPHAAQRTVKQPPHGLEPDPLMLAQLLHLHPQPTLSTYPVSTASTKPPLHQTMQPRPGSRAASAPLGRRRRGPPAPPQQQQPAPVAAPAAPSHAFSHRRAASALKPQRSQRASDAAPAAGPVDDETGTAGTAGSCAHCRGCQMHTFNSKQRAKSTSVARSSRTDSRPPWRSPSPHVRLKGLPPPALPAAARQGQGTTASAIPVDHQPCSCCAAEHAATVYIGAAAPVAHLSRLQQLSCTCCRGHRCGRCTHDASREAARAAAAAAAAEAAATVAAAVHHGPVTPSRSTSQQHAHTATGDSALYSPTTSIASRYSCSHSYHGATAGDEKQAEHGATSLAMRHRRQVGSTDSSDSNVDALYWEEQLLRVLLGLAPMEAADTAHHNVETKEEILLQTVTLEPPPEALQQAAQPVIALPALPDVAVTLPQLVSVLQVFSSEVTSQLANAAAEAVGDVLAVDSLWENDDGSSEGEGEWSRRSRSRSRSASASASASHDGRSRSPPRRSVSFSSEPSVYCSRASSVVSSPVGALRISAETRTAIAPPAPVSSSSSPPRPQPKPHPPRSLPPSYIPHHDTLGAPAAAVSVSVAPPAVPVVVTPSAPAPSAPAAVAAPVARPPSPAVSLASGPPMDITIPIRAPSPLPAASAATAPAPSFAAVAMEPVVEMVAATTATAPLQPPAEKAEGMPSATAAVTTSTRVSVEMGVQTSFAADAGTGSGASGAPVSPGPGPSLPSSDPSLLAGATAATVLSPVHCSIYAPAPKRRHIASPQPIRHRGKQPLQQQDGQQAAAVLLPRPSPHKAAAATAATAAATAAAPATISSPLPQWAAAPPAATTTVVAVPSPAAAAAVSRGVTSGMVPVRAAIPEPLQSHSPPVLHETQSPHHKKKRGGKHKQRDSDDGSEQQEAVAAAAAPAEAAAQAAEEEAEAHAAARAQQTTGSVPADAHAGSSDGIRRSRSIRAATVAPARVASFDDSDSDGSAGGEGEEEEEEGGAAILRQQYEDDGGDSPVTAARRRLRRAVEAAQYVSRVLAARPSHRSGNSSGSGRGIVASPQLQPRMPAADMTATLQASALQSPVARALLAAAPGPVYATAPQPQPQPRPRPRPPFTRLKPGSSATSLRAPAATPSRIRFAGTFTGTTDTATSVAADTVTSVAAAAVSGYGTQSSVVVDQPLLPAYELQQQQQQYGRVAAADISTLSATRTLPVPRILPSPVSASSTIVAATPRRQQQQGQQQQQQQQRGPSPARSVSFAPVMAADALPRPLHRTGAVSRSVSSCGPVVGVAGDSLGFARPGSVLRSLLQPQAQPHAAAATAHDMTAALARLAFTDPAHPKTAALAFHLLKAGMR